jgi:hypothetical protein
MMMATKVNIESILQRLKLLFGVTKPPPRSVSRGGGTTRLSVSKKKKGALDSVLAGVKRAVGVHEAPPALPRKEGCLVFSTLGLTKSARDKVSKCDRNEDGYLTVQELNAMVRIPDLDDETKRVLKSAVAQLNEEITTLYTEALGHFNVAKDELNQLQHQGFEHFQIPELVERGGKIEQVLSKLVSMLQSKPETMGVVRGEVRSFIKDVRNLTKT